jgi:hypothetical protein
MTRELRETSPVHWVGIVEGYKVLSGIRSVIVGDERTDWTPHITIATGPRLVDGQEMICPLTFEPILHLIQVVDGVWVPL